MKTLFLVLSLISLGSFAATVEATCKATKKNDLFSESKTLELKVNAKEVKAKPAEYKDSWFTGNYSGEARNGSLMYSSSDLTDVADQTDYAYIFVSPKILDGENGTVSFSVRQLGDSEGAWWISSTFFCVVK